MTQNMLGGLILIGMGLLTTYVTKSEKEWTAYCGNYWKYYANESWRKITRVFGLILVGMGIFVALGFLPFD